MKMIAVEQMKQAEEAANAHGLTYQMMMENAGKSLAEYVFSYSQNALKPPVILGLVGPGNNGGDTLIAMAHLAQKGVRVYAICLGRAMDIDTLCQRFVQSGGKIQVGLSTNINTFLADTENTSLIILDGLLGTGYRAPMQKEFKRLLRAIKEYLKDKETAILAVDCPSGTNCTTGDVDVDALKADMTICMAAVKEGLMRFPAFGYAGRLVVADIGLDSVINGWDADLPVLATREVVSSWLPYRKPDSHKGTYGKTLIIGGSVNYCGAILLAANAAHRSGVGLVTAGITDIVFSAIAGNSPETTWLILPGELGSIKEDAVSVLRSEIHKYQSLAVGPGMGVNKSTQGFIINTAHLFGSGSHGKSGHGIGFLKGESQEIIKENLHHPPLVIDADALKCLSKISDWWKLLGENVVLTPHPGEMSILTGLAIEEIQLDRIGITHKYASIWNKVVVLKGALTVIADPKGNDWILPVATSALAHAGTGDVLTGLISGYLAQGLPCSQAAVLACYLHSEAALAATRKIGGEASVLAGDVVLHIPEAICQLEQKE